MPRAALYRGKQGCLALGYLSEHFRIAFQVCKPCLAFRVSDAILDVHFSKHHVQYSRIAGAESPHSELMWFLCR